MHLLVCLYIEFKVMNPIFFCLLHSEKLKAVTNGSPATHAISLCSVLHLRYCSQWGTKPVVLELHVGVPAGGTQLNSPLPNRARGFSVPLEKEHHHAHGMRVLTLPSHLPEAASLPAVPCCSLQLQAGIHGDVWLNMLRICQSWHLGKLPGHHSL